MKTVYVAGPLIGDFAGNTARAIEVADELLDGGVAPFVPHLAIHWHAVHEHHYEDWMAYDFAWILKCDALVRMPGKSPGADREVEFARKHGIPVFFGINECLAWARNTP